MLGIYPFSCCSCVLRSRSPVTRGTFVTMNPPEASAAGFRSVPTMIGAWPFSPISAKFSPRLIAAEGFLAQAPASSRRDLLTLFSNQAIHPQELGEFPTIVVSPPSQLPAAGRALSPHGPQGPKRGTLFPRWSAGTTRFCRRFRGGPAHYGCVSPAAGGSGSPRHQTHSVILSCIS